MKIKVLSIISLSLCYLLIAGVNCFAQDEAAYKKELSQASAQKNPSGYRASALKKYLATADTLKNSEGNGMSEKELNQVVASKLKEMMAIDFYAAFLAQLPPTPDFIKWREVLELVSAEQVAAFKKLTQWRTNGSQTPYPADVPKPGFGWVENHSKVVPAKNPVNTANNNQAKPSDLTKAFEFQNLGVKQVKEGKYDEAIKNFSECIKIDQKKKIFQCYLGRGIAYYEKKNFDAAITDLTQSIQLEPKDFQSYEYRAESYLYKTNYPAAINDFNSALKIQYDAELEKRLNALVFNNYFEPAFKQYNEGNNDEALRNLSECVRFSKKLHQCYILRGTILFNREYSVVGTSEFKMINVDAAINDFTQAIQLESKNEGYYRYRAESYVLKENYDAAIADLESALSLKFDYKTKQRIEALKSLRDKKKKPQ